MKLEAVCSDWQLLIRGVVQSGGLTISPDMTRGVMQSGEPRMVLEASDEVLLSLPTIMAV